MGGSGVGQVGHGNLQHLKVHPLLSVYMFSKVIFKTIWDEGLDTLSPMVINRLCLRRQNLHKTEFMPWIT